MASSKVSDGSKHRPGPDTARPGLLVDPVNPDVTVGQMRDVFAANGQFFDRGGPVRIIIDPTDGGAIASRQNPDAIVLAAHRLARPYKLLIKPRGKRLTEDACLPKSIAAMYLRAESDQPELYPQALK